jgi:hypothetical protein
MAGNKSLISSLNISSFSLLAYIWAVRAISFYAHFLYVRLMKIVQCLALHAAGDTSNAKISHLNNIVSQGDTCFKMFILLSSNAYVQCPIQNYFI